MEIRFSKLYHLISGRNAYFHLKVSSMGGEDRGGLPDLDPDLPKSRGGHPDSYSNLSKSWGGHPESRDEKVGISQDVS